MLFKKYPLFAPSRSHQYWPRRGKSALTIIALRNTYKYSLLQQGVSESVCPILNQWRARVGFRAYALRSNISEAESFYKVYGQTAFKVKIAEMTESHRTFS